MRDYKVPANKAALRAASHDKCMYCESKISHTDFGDIEHHRPKAKFPHFAFSWDNLGFVCGRCNNSKSDKWSDHTPFVDPFSDDPSDHLAALGEWVFHCNGSERGEYTWREIGLNRPELIERRGERIKAIRDLLDKVARTQNAALSSLIVRELEAELLDDKEFSMVCRAAYRQLRRTT